MSNFLRSGEGKDLSLTPGQSIAISTITGTVTADVIAGTAKGTNLLNASTSGGTFGPYASGAVIRVTAGEGAIVDYDIGITPVNAFDDNAKLAFDSSGNTVGIADPVGGVISFAGPAYTFSGLPAASANNLGMSARVTDIGPAGGTIFISTGTYWKPMNGTCVLTQGNGSIAAPIQTLSAAGKFTLPADTMVVGGSLVLPVGLLRPGMSIVVTGKFKHRGTGGAWTTTAKLGTLNTSSDNTIAGLVGAATDNQDVWMLKECHVVSATSFTADGFLVPNAFGPGGLTDKNSNFNTAAMNYIGFHLAAVNASDFVDLIQYRVELRG